MSDSLLPCPFCGAAARLFQIQERDAHWVACVSCGIMTPLRYAKVDGYSVTISMWNRRSLGE
jgi:Lar family restriction alleviation protein